MVTGRLQATTITSSRVPGWEWVQTALLATNLAWTTFCLGGYRAETQLVTLTLTGILLFVHFLSRMTRQAEIHRLHPAGWLMLPFLAYGAANVLWVTPVPWLGWLDWLGWFQMAAVFWVGLNGIRSGPARRVLFLTLVALGIVGVLFACYQRFVRPDWIIFGRVRAGDFGGRASGTFGIPNSFAGYLLLLLPAVGALAWRRSASATERVWWGWVTVVLSLGLVLTISRGAWVALVVAATIWPLVFARGGWWRRVRLAGVVLLAVALVGGAIYAKSPKVRARFATLVLDSGEKTRPVMWSVAWRLFREHPVTGTGAGSYNVLFERHRPEGFRDEPLWAHNEYLNTLSDYGVAGFGLLFGGCAVIAVGCALGRRDEKNRLREWLDSPTVGSALGMGLLAFALQLMVDFHFKIPALALASATIAALAVSRAWPPATGAASSSWWHHRGAPPLMMAGVVAIGIFFLPQIRAEGLRQRARQAIERLAGSPPESPAYRARLADTRTGLLRATRLTGANAQAWADLSYATALWALVEPQEVATLGREAEAAAEQALGRSRVCSEFWIRRGVARDMQGRWPEAGKDFAAAVALAPADSIAWYYYADHLSRLKAGREIADAALAFCLRLDPGNAAGLALRQRLALNLKAP